METALATGALGSLLVALVWTRVGLALTRRDIAAEHRGAAGAFAAAWFLAGAYAAIGALLAGAVASGAVVPTSLALAAAWTSAVLGVSMVGAFVAHLAHLLTGHPRAVRRVLVAYAAQVALLAAVLLALGPTGAEANGWTLRFTFAHAGVSANRILALAVVLPALVASFSYLALARKAATTTARWRVLFVGGGLTVWVLAAALTRVADLPDGSLAAGRIVGGLAALAVLVAYWPPAFARSRWGVGGLEEDLAADPSRRQASDAASEARRRAFATRVRELI